MAYIGVTPDSGFTTGLLDRFTSTTGSTVTLTHDIASENDIIVFVNFVKQDSTNYSVGGSGNKTLTLGGTLVSSDVVEVHYLNIVKSTQQPSANSVGITQLNVSDGSNGQALTTNGSGTLSFSTIASGITEADQWRISSDFSGVNSSTLVSANWERNDTLFDKVGTGMSQSSGVFSFPSTGIYHLTWIGYFKITADTQYLGLQIKGTSDNSSYSLLAQNYISWIGYYGTGTVYGTVINQATFDCQNTTNYKVGFYVDGSTTNYSVGGASSAQLTGATFIRLGDT